MRPPTPKAPRPRRALATACLSAALLSSLLTPSAYADAASSASPASPAAPGAQDPVEDARRHAAPGMPEGVNDWSCRPSRARPNPVVLAHGTFTPSARTWKLLAPSLVRRGFCVYALDYGVIEGRPGIAGIGPVAESAAQLGTFVDGVRAATGAAKVDIVGYSQGGLMPRHYLRFLGGAEKVDRLVGIAPDNHGVQFTTLLNMLKTATGPVAGIVGALPDLENLPLGVSKLIPQVPALIKDLKRLGEDPMEWLLKDCPACRDQLVGSEFLRRLNDGHETEPGVRYTVLSSRMDNVGTDPATQALKGVPQEWIQDYCSFSLGSLPMVAHALMPSDHVVRHRTVETVTPGRDAATNCWSRSE